MLKRLFTSNTRIKLLTTFLLNPDQEFFIRELTRRLNEQINSIRRELDNLKKIGILKTKSKSRKKYYYVNKNFFLLPELTALISKAIASDKKIAQDLERMGEIKMLALAGLFINKPTETIDMLIVGNIDREKLANYLNVKMQTERPVKFTVLTEDDYRYRINCHDQFIQDIISSKENFIPIKRI